MRRGLRRVGACANARKTALPAPTISSISPATGSPNQATPVTIVGTGFSGGGATSVTIDSVLGDFVVVDSTHITATFPVDTHLGDVYDVIVTGPGGSNTLTNGFSIPLAGIDSIENTTQSTTNTGSGSTSPECIIHGWGLLVQNISNVLVFGGSDFYEFGFSTGDDNTGDSGSIGHHATGAASIQLIGPDPFPVVFTWASHWTYT